MVHDDQHDHKDEHKIHGKFFEMKLIIVGSAMAILFLLLAFFGIRHYKRSRAQEKENEVTNRERFQQFVERMKLGQSGSKLAEMGAAETFVGMAILASPLLPTRDSKESIRRSSTKKSKRTNSTRATHVYRQCIADKVAQMTSKERIAAYLEANVKQQQPRVVDLSIKPVTPLVYPKFKKLSIKTVT